MILRCALLLTLLSAAALRAESPPPPEVIALLKETQSLQQQQRYVEAMVKLDEIEALAPGLADLYNLRGALYLTPALRDFDKATEQLDKAAALQPGAVAPLFNKAELLFVKHDWAAAAAAFQKLLDQFPKLPMQVRHLTLYKRLICEVKQGQFEAAEKTLKDHFKFMDDTPAYYYSQVAIAYGKDDEIKAKEWLSRADAIYKPAEASAYLDSLMEARWVGNISLPPLEKK
ncbi:tetratricopeptide repeat protein [Prosthecobacter sp. SYSU 5D2]|uniref:tetratricopeptide repeat protein n=1 Tax=Prosthecobacter sp. SYSU 5D2 TaxID=3134134 RepID=UPI0031FF27CF